MKILKKSVDNAMFIKFYVVVARASRETRHCCHLEKENIYKHASFIQHSRHALLVNYTHTVINYISNIQ